MQPTERVSHSSKSQPGGHGSPTHARRPKVQTVPWTPLKCIQFRIQGIRVLPCQCHVDGSSQSAPIPNFTMLIGFFQANQSASTARIKSSRQRRRRRDPEGNMSEGETRHKSTAPHHRERERPSKRNPSRPKPRSKLTDSAEKYRHSPHATCIDLDNEGTTVSLVSHTELMCIALSCWSGAFKIPYSSTTGHVSGASTPQVEKTTVAHYARLSIPAVSFAFARPTRQWTSGFGCTPPSLQHWLGRS